MIGSRTLTEGTLLWLFLLHSTIVQVSCYSSNSVNRRRAIFQSMTLVTATPHTAHAVLSSKPCASGVGEGCDELAGDNAFIKELQAKSAQNKELYQQESLNAYYMKNYPEFFAALNPPRYLIKQPDGKFGVYTDKELAVLKSQNRIGIENPKTKGGKFMDYTQKPIMVLKPEINHNEPPAQEETTATTTSPETVE